MFDDRLEILRKKKNLSMRQLAIKLGMPYTTYVNYEKNSREPNSEVLIAIADFFNISTDYLLGRSNEINGAGTLTKAKRENVVVTPQAQRIAELYDKANEDDKKIVELTLSKYDKKSNSKKPPSTYDAMEIAAEIGEIAGESAKDYIKNNSQSRTVD